MNNQSERLGSRLRFIMLSAGCAIGFAVLSFDLQGGLERVTKYMMVALFCLMLVLAFHSAILPGAKEGLSFCLVPDFSKINGQVIVGAMNQASKDDLYRLAQIIFFV